MAFDKAREHLSEYGLSDRIQQFSVSSATVAEAAIAVGCSEAEIAKSLSFTVNGEPVIIIAAGDAKIDNSKYKSRFHTKAKMIPFDEVESVIGHAAGGVCPFGINDGVTVYLDTSLKRFETVYPACGSASSAVRLSIAELEMASRFVEWIDVCKLCE